MSSGGGRLETQTVLGEMLGKEGVEGAFDHLPITPSGTEYHANKILSILAPWILPLLPLFTFPETWYIPQRHHFPAVLSSAGCFSSNSRFLRPGGGVSVFLSAHCRFQTTASPLIGL